MTDSRNTNSQQQNWDAVASEWSRHFDWYSAAFQPLVEWCCEAIELQPHFRVLDIASGTGVPSLAIASRLQADGSIIASDISGEMLRLLQRRAGAMGLDHIEFAEVDAQRLTFPDQSFDAVTCAFGLMFCPQPAGVLAEVHRVLKPGAHFAISTWAPPAENPFISIYGRAVAEVLRLPRYDRDAPGPFRLAYPEALHEMGIAAGFENISLTRRPQTIVYQSVDVYHAASQALTPGLTARINALTPLEIQRLRGLVHDGVQPFMRGAEVHLTATPICVSARRTR